MGLFEDIANNYFIDPLVNQTGKYNVVNTVVYAIVLFFVAYILYEKVLKKRVTIDKNFALAFSSFAVLASSLHVLKDMGILPKIIFDTPSIYVLMGFLFLVSFVISKILEKEMKIAYWKTLSFIALAPAVVIIIFILSNAHNLAGLVYVLSLFAISNAVIYLAGMKFAKILTKENFAVLAAHMLDASSTFVAISFFNYGEQHMVPTFLMGLFGPVAMFPLKLLIIGAVILILDKDIKDKNFRTFIKLVILVLGLAPGLRDALRLAVFA
ncbi:MAG: DUF63 family protein [Candidatus Aenigmatarchaeota archaeon]